MNKAKEKWQYFVTYITISKQTHFLFRMPKFHDIVKLFKSYQQSCTNCLLVFVFVTFDCLFNIFFFLFFPPQYAVVSSFQYPVLLLLLTI